MSERRSIGSMSDTAVRRVAGIYSVATLGFASPERRAIRGVLGLTEQGAPIFRPYVEASNENPDIVVVNADDPDALRLGMGLKHSARHRRVTAIFVTRESDVMGARYM